LLLVCGFWYLHLLEELTLLPGAAVFSLMSFSSFLPWMQSVQQRSVIQGPRNHQPTASGSKDNRETSRKGLCAHVPASSSAPSAQYGMASQACLTHRAGSMRTARANEKAVEFLMFQARYSNMMFKPVREQMMFRNSVRRTSTAPANTGFTAFCIGLEPFRNSPRRIRTPLGCLGRR